MRFPLRNSKICDFKGMVSVCTCTIDNIDLGFILKSLSQVFCHINLHKNGT